MIEGTGERTEVKPVEVEEVKEWKVKRILNKQKVRGVIKYLHRKTKKVLK